MTADVEMSRCRGVPGFYKGLCAYRLLINSGGWCVANIEVKYGTCTDKNVANIQVKYGSCTAKNVANTQVKYGTCTAKNVANIEVKH